MAARLKAVQSLDPLFMAQSLFRRHKYQQCVELCTQILDRSPDQAAWCLKMRAMVEDIRPDDIELEDEGIADEMMEENSTAQVPRPGTSFKRPLTNAGSSPAIRPMSKAGRPVTGFVRPGTQSARPTTMERAVRTARSGTAARPVTSASGRFVRLGTASMQQQDAAGFIDTQKIDLRKYARWPSLAKALFQYMFYVTNDTLRALELASLATEAASFKDWWWKAGLGMCYLRLGLLRDAEKQLLSAIKERPMIITSVLLAKVYIRLDQPQNALACYQDGLEHFPDSTTLIASIARVHEGIGDLPASVESYRTLLKQDSTNVEAIASLAADAFYANEPEKALILYRRLLQMGVTGPELFNNLGLCCFYAQQYDMALVLFERALSLASDEAMADVWFNISHVAMAMGDVTFAYQCLKLAVVCDPNHAEAFNNLGVIEFRKQNADTARAHYQSAIQLSPELYEPHFNFALLSFQKGDVQQSFSEASAALGIFQEHIASKELLQQLRSLLNVL